MGAAFLVDRPAILGALMLFASGGILYLIFEDIAPGVPLANHRTPALGAVAGFLLGVLGHMLAGC